MINNFIIESVEDEIEDDYCPNPAEPSTVCFDVSFEPIGNNWQPHVEIYWYEGGGAEYESEFGGFLDYTIEGMLDDYTPGVYIMEGFHASYFKDYLGEVDANFYYDEIRPATIEEIAEAFGANFWGNT